MTYHRRPRATEREGFTLIELLVVMAIIATLVAISIPAVMKAREVSNRTVCSNNLHQLHTAFLSHQTELGYLPTAGYSDFCWPTYTTSSASSTGVAVVGWHQQAGWAYQILHYLDEDNIRDGGIVVANSKGTAASTPPQQAAYAVGTPIKFFFCPSRRTMTAYSITASSTWPSNYSGVSGTFPCGLSDYAACNGNAVPPATGSWTFTAGNGMALSQFGGRATVSTTDATDGQAYTLLLGEKAVDPMHGPVSDEDDIGYASAFSRYNFNTIRFTAPTVLPLKDADVIKLGGAKPTGGAFGGPHANTWNAVMVDGSVRPISYNIDPGVFSALGTRNGRELINDQDLQP